MLGSALWGLVGGSTLVLGALVGRRVSWPMKSTALIMAFGAGVLIASVAYELIDEAAQHGTLAATAGGLAAGSLTFFVGDVLIARAGAKERKRASGPTATTTAAASGSALALGALLDGVPESAAIGVTILEGGAPSLAFVAAVALSNFPEGLSSAMGMRTAGRTTRHILVLWGAIALAAPLPRISGSWRWTARPMGRSPLSCRTPG